MKAAALMLGILLLSSQAFAAGGAAERGTTARGDRTMVTPRPSEKAAAVLDVPAATARAEQTLPPDLITTSPEGEEIAFLMTVLENGRVLAWLGELTRNKAERGEVRVMGDSLQKRQERGNRLLVQLAKRKGLNVEENDQPIQLNAIASRLPHAVGPNLDAALTRHIISASENGVSVYELGLRSKDEEIRKLSEQMLPQMKEQLQLARRMMGEAR